MDFPHAIEHLTAAAQPSLGSGTPTFSAWLDQQAHTLKHAADGPRQVLAALARLPVQVAVDPIVAAEARDGAMAYFTKRLAQIQYATFRAAEGQWDALGARARQSARRAADRSLC